jgi:hypothetical protein
VSKQEILDFFAETYSLQYETRQFSENSPATGAKNIYYSTYDKANKLGYNPKYCSLETIKTVATDIIIKKGKGLF